MIRVGMVKKNVIKLVGMIVRVVVLLVRVVITLIHMKYLDHIMMKF